MTAKPGPSVTWAVEGDLDIFSLRDQATHLQTLLTPGHGLTIDLSRMGDLDPSGLQLLLALRATQHSKHMAFNITGLSEPLHARLRALGVGDHFLTEPA